MQTCMHGIHAYSHMYMYTYKQTCIHAYTHMHINTDPYVSIYVQDIDEGIDSDMHIQIQIQIYRYGY